MTAKEKAKELVDKFSDYAHWSVGSANNDFSKINCALIAVDEIIKEVTPKVSIYTYQLQFWEEVKHELTTYQP
jgi:hypothetical protein